MMGSVLSNGFQFIVSGSPPKALNDFQIVNLQVLLQTLCCNALFNICISYVYYSLHGIDTVSWVTGRASGL